MSQILSPSLLSCIVGSLGVTTVFSPTLGQVAAFREKVEKHQQNPTRLEPVQPVRNMRLIVGWPSWLDKPENRELAVRAGGCYWLERSALRNWTFTEHTWEMPSHWYRMLSSTLLHQSYPHLLINGMTVAIYGSIAERRLMPGLGPWVLWSYYLPMLVLPNVVTSVSAFVAKESAYEPGGENISDLKYGTGGPACVNHFCGLSGLALGLSGFATGLEVQVYRAWRKAQHTAPINEGKLLARYFPLLLSPGVLLSDLWDRDYSQDRDLGAALTGHAAAFALGGLMSIWAARRGHILWRRDATRGVFGAMDAEVAR